MSPGELLGLLGSSIRDYIDGDNTGKSYIYFQLAGSRYEYYSHNEKMKPDGAISGRFTLYGIQG
jgi:hypothetical protein